MADPGDLNRFLVLFSLVPDLYCPGSSSAEALSKEANLLRTAMRYTVDASKITIAVTPELSARREGGKAHSHNLQKQRRVKGRDK